MTQHSDSANMREANRKSWNAATFAHNRRKRDQAVFFREGGSTLFQEEIELLGPLEGVELVHLQCNSGQDSLSLARLGARVTGVDISDEAIRFAEELARESGIGATFVRSDVYDWLRETSRRGQRFDVAFCSYGAICWLTDLAGWARGVRTILRQGGRFVCIDFHPYAGVFSEQWDVSYPYGAAAGPIVMEDGVGDYVAASGDALTPSGGANDDADFRNPHPSYEFNWSIAEVVQALIDAGMHITTLREYPYANGWRGFDRMRALPGGRWAPPADVPELPLMYSIIAQVPGASYITLPDDE